MVRLVEGRIVQDEPVEGFGCTPTSKINLFGFRVPLLVALAIAIFVMLQFGPGGLFVMAVIAGTSLQEW